jgi:CheY-like chemotaxis protein
MHNNAPILIVEDDQIDALTIQRALRELHVTNPLIHAGNGEEALLYLQNNEQAVPCIILLDLNMPRMSGLELLEILKKEEKYRYIPVIVLTSSQDESDCSRSFGLGVAGYMVKPVDYIQFVEIVKSINFYWTLSQIPPH